MDFMEELVGIPYKDGGLSPEEGMDCWGLVRWVIERGLRIKLPEKPIAWRRHGRVLPFSLAAVQRYDILFFSDDLGIVAHIGIANSPTDFTHANQYCCSVVCEPINKYRDSITAIGRVKRAD